MAQMPFISAAGDELRQCLLFESGGMAVTEPLARGKGRHERFRCNQVPDPQRGKNRARKCSQVNHTAFGVEALHRLDWLPLIAELAVVVIFYHDGARLLRPFEQS